MGHIEVGKGPKTFYIQIGHMIEKLVILAEIMSIFRQLRVGHSSDHLPT